MSIEARRGKHGVTYRVTVYHNSRKVVQRSFSAKAAAKRFETDIKSRLNSNSYIDDRLGSMLLTDALDGYVSDVSPTLKGGHTDRSRARQIQKYALSKKKLSEVRPSDIVHFRKTRLSSHAANEVRLCMALISQTFVYAREELKMDFLVNPVSGVKRPSLVGTARDRVLNVGEYEHLIAAAETFDSTMRHIIPFAIETAMRQGEIASITPDMFDANLRVVTLTETKNGTSRVVPLSRLALASIIACGCIAGPVFGYASAHSISKAFRKVTKKAGIVGLTFHDLRHEATTRLFKKGLTAEQVKSITGHKSYAMLARYTHVNTIDLVDLLD